MYYIYFFIFTYNKVFEIIVYKEMLKIVFLFETLLRMHEIQKERILIVHVINVSDNKMIEDGVDRSSRSNYFGGIMRGIYLLKFTPLQLGDL